MGFFNFKCNPLEELKPLPRMSNTKLSELVKAVTEGKVIQMCWEKSMNWGDMSHRSLEQFLDVFLEERWGFPVWFRVKPEEVPTNLEVALAASISRRGLEVSNLMNLGAAYTKRHGL